MELDVLGLVAACSYALDCVETELVHVTSRHAKRVAYMSVCVAEQLGICGKDLQDLAVYALLHDNALTQYIQEELHSNLTDMKEMPRIGVHCSIGEENIQGFPFHTDVKMQMGADHLERNLRRYRFFRGSYICVICWIRHAAAKRLPQRHGNGRRTFSKG